MTNRLRGHEFKVHGEVEDPLVCRRILKKESMGRKEEVGTPVEHPNGMRRSERDSICRWHLNIWAGSTVNLRYFWTSKVCFGLPRSFFPEVGSGLWALGFCWRTKPRRYGSSVVHATIQRHRNGPGTEFAWGAGAPGRRSQCLPATRSMPNHRTLTTLGVSWRKDLKDLISGSRREIANNSRGFFPSIAVCQGFWKGSIREYRGHWMIRASDSARISCCPILLMPPSSAFCTAIDQALFTKSLWTLVFSRCREEREEVRSAEEIRGYH
jgi:hypothetical protein